MKAKSTILAAAVATVLSAGMVGEASAGIYARSYLAIDGLQIRLSDDGGGTAGGATVKSFQFNLQNQADLNGGFDGDAAACSGLPGAPAAGVNNCNPRPNTGLNTPGTVLDERAVNGGIGTPVRPNNIFTFYGPGTNEYSNADSVIYTAQLTGGVPTSTEQIAESELQSGTSASALAEIQSTTGFLMKFTVVGANQIDIKFSADSSRLAQIDDLIAQTASAKSNMNVEFVLENDSNGQFVRWRPNGNTATGADTNIVGGVATELRDDFDLQQDFNVTSLPCSNNGAPAPGACPSAGFTRIGDLYELLFTGLYDGDWTLGLTANTSTSLARTVPEPASLALVGMALAGMGFAARRRNRA